ncbi:MAG: CPBP family intramembrane metalloprotease [Ruminococcaceae bacterium]|nr:CPBP family intramembrane metalloprotease [Oscillospiraceae bacterium]
MRVKEKNNAKTAPSSDEKRIVLQPTVVVLATYILLLLSKIIDLTLINRDNEYMSVVILQMMIFLIPAAVWCRFSGERYIRSLRIRPIKANSVLIIIAAALLMTSGGILLSLLFGGLESLSANFSLYNTFVSKDDGTAPIKLYLILAYAVLPAIGEEFVYRGILCHEYEKGGVMRAIALSSLFFALLHFDVKNLPVYLFAGAILAITMYATRSLLGAVIAHFLYNLFGLFGQPYINTFYNITGSTEFFVFILGFVFLGSAALFCGEASRLYRIYLARSYPSSYRTPEIKGFENIRNSYIEVLTKPSAIACYALYIVTVIVVLIRS